MAFGFRISTPTSPTYSQLPAIPSDPESSDSIALAPPEPNDSLTRNLLNIIPRWCWSSPKARRRTFLLVIATFVCTVIGSALLLTPLSEYAVAFVSPVRFPPTYQSYKEREERLVRRVHGDPKLVSHRPGIKYFFPEKHVHGTSSSESAHGCLPYPPLTF